MELISRDEAIVMLEDMEGRRDEDGYIKVYKCDAIDNLKSLPTIEERNEGRWIDHKSIIMTDPEIWGYSQECSLCGFVLGAKEYNYCPNCGAKMKGESNGIINNME